MPDLESIPHAVPFTTRPSAAQIESTEADVQSVHGDLFQLSGSVEVHFRNRTLQADSVTYNRATGEVTAEGHVRLSGGDNDELIEASRGTYNIRTGTGRLYDVSGSVGLRAGAAGATASGTDAPPNPFLFAGRLVVKTGPEHYDIYDGWVTSCELPRPDWQLFAGRLTLDNKVARGRSSTFRLLNVPILFLPYVTHPVDENQRQSGLLIPVISQSSTKGFIFGEQAYITLGRSADATAGFEYFSSRGFSEMGTVRFRGRGDDFLNAHFSALQDRGYYDSFGHYIDQGGEDVTASFRRDFTPTLRGVGDAEYLSSYVYREAFNDNFNQAVSSDITSITYLTHQSNGFDISGRFDRYQGLKRVPYTNSAGQQVQGQDVRIFHAPSLDAVALDHHLGTTPLLWGVNASVAGLKRVQPNFATTGVVPRLDLRPELALPLAGGGWHTLTSVAVRETHYAKSRAVPYGAGAAPVELDQGIDRTSLELKVDVRPPVIERTFAVPPSLQKLLGTEVRHTVEPQLVYRKTSGIDNFLSILRFDDLDLDANTNSLEYGVTQHVYFRKPVAAAAVTPACAQHRAQIAARKAADAASDENPTPAAALDDAVVPTADNSTDANGIPSVSATAPDMPLRAHARAYDPCVPEARPARQQEWFSWRLAQRYFFDPNFGGAVVNGRRNVFDSTLSLSGIAFLTEPRNISPLISRMRLRTSSHTDLAWDFDLDTGAKRFTSSNIFLDAHERQWFGGFSYALLDAPGRFFTEQIDTSNNQQTIVSSPNSNFSQMRVLIGYGAPTKPGLSAAANAGLDLGNTSLQYASLQASYNWNCCGLSVEYRKYELGSVRNEGVERFSFTLINIGSAGNLRRQERLF